MLLDVDAALFWGQKPLLEELRFSLSAGEFLVVLGPNGVGKSSLLQCLAGQKTPSLKVKGKLQLKGKDLAQYSLSEMAKFRAVMSQSLHLPFPLKVQEFMSLGHAQQKAPLSDERALDLLAQLGLKGYEDRLWQQLSGGERQRLQLARLLWQLEEAIEQKEALLLLDEPLAALDIAHQQQLMQLVAQLCKEQQLGALAILHDINIAAQYADRLLLLAPGQQWALGPPEEVLTQEALKAMYQVETFIEKHPIHHCPQVIFSGWLKGQTI